MDRNPCFLALQGESVNVLAPQYIIHHGIANRVDGMVVAVWNLINPVPVAVAQVLLQGELGEGKRIQKHE